MQDLTKGLHIFKQNSNRKSLFEQRDREGRFCGIFTQRFGAIMGKDTQDVILMQLLTAEIKQC